MAAASLAARSLAATAASRSTRAIRASAFRWSAPAFSGESATCYLRLDNKLAVSGFNLLVRYDVSALSLETITKVGTRAESFTSYTVTSNVGGQAGLMRIVGQAPVGSPLEVGDGPIVKMTYRTTGDLNFAGMSIPVKFEFLDVVTKAFQHRKRRIDHEIHDGVQQIIERLVRMEEDYFAVHRQRYSGFDGSRQQSKERRCEVH